MSKEIEATWNFWEGWTSEEIALKRATYLAQTELVPQNYQVAWNKIPPVDHPNYQEIKANMLRAASYSIIVAIGFGMGYGLSPAQSLRSIYVVNGRAELYGNAIPAVGMMDPRYVDHDVEVTGDGDKLVATAWVAFKGPDGEIRKKVRTVSTDQIKTNGAWSKTNSLWPKHYHTMLPGRAINLAFKATFPGRYAGLSSDEDMAEDIARIEAHPQAGAKTPGNLLDAAMAPKALPEPATVVTLPKTETSPAAVEKVAAKPEAAPQAEQPVARQKKTTEKPAPIAQVQPEPVKQAEPVPVVQTVQPADDELPGLEETKEELKQETVVAAPIPSPEVAPTGSSEYVKALKAITAATMEASVTSVVMQAMTSYKAGVLTRSEYQLLVKAGYLRRLGMDLTLQAIDGMLIMSQKADMTPEDALVVKIECITRLAIGASLLPLSDADRLKWENHIMEQIKSIQPTHQALVLRCIINTAPSIASLEARNEGSMVAASGSIKALLSGLNWLRDGRTENDTSRALGAAYKERLAALK